MKTFFTAVLVFTCASLLRAQENPNRIYYPKLGFSIQPLEEESVGSNYVVLQMYLPPTEKGSPNINVMLQEYKESLEEYKIFSDMQLKSINVSILSSAIKDNAYIVEYTGQMSGKSIHVYTRAVKKGDRIYLITAAASPDQWREYSGKLIRTVNSFRLQ